VAVRSSLGVDRPAQVEVAQDRRGAQVEVLADELLDPGDRQLLGAEALDEDRERVRHTDRVRNLDLRALGEARCNDVLRDGAA
jgi:hypothetical protein